LADIKRFAANPRMSGAVVHGGVAYLSGQVAIDHRGGAVADQVREVLERIDALLVEVGSDRSRLLTASIFLSDLAVLPELNAAWDPWIVPGCAPTRTTMQVVLASPLYALEIAVTAAVD
jgi:enamine deaminase RidA (YjgF/YER057c/UK114 family)